MTKNQIEYAKLLELQRSNQAQEALTQARDLETQRHNVVAESVSLDQVRETSRANRALEGYRAQQVTLQGQLQEETKRHNIASEVEVHRSNVAGEQLRSQELSETARSHRAQEGIGVMQVEQRREQAAQQYQSTLLQLGETKRHNIETESEISRSHTATEAETKRSNQAREAETTRHNEAAEMELNRHNIISEHIGMKDASARTAGVYQQMLNGAAKFIPILGG